MKKINIVILDDEIRYINTIKNICLEYYSTKNILTCINTLDNPVKLFEIDFLDIDVLLLDIEMPNLNGLEIAHKVRAINKKCFICFITNYNDYIFKSYDVHAFDYIMKPVEKERLFKLFDDVNKYQKLQNNDNHKKIKFNTNVGELIINQNDILYFEYHDSFNDFFNRVTVLHTIKEKYILKEKLKDIASKVDDSIFVSPHKSFIVNMDCIKQISKNEIIMQNDVMIPLSQKKSSSIRKKFTQYIREFYEEA